ncbi:hypothetical protein E8E14_003560 [Neopestalotiopsis sp. 37M]|nr:hypothetical protein E8E14_003560 [Neopestalotiopsis sp. 37M]
MTAPSSECAAANIAHSCTICDQMVIDLDQNNQRHVLGRLDELLRQPGGENCELLRQYTAKSKAGPETAVELGVSRYRGRREDLRAYIMRQGFNDDDGDTDSQGFRVYAAADDLASAAVPSRPPGIDIGLERAFKVARGWLSRCGKGHLGCSFHRSTGSVPTRVIDISKDIPRLVESRTAGLGSSAKYVALSYCWGGPQPVETTKATLQQHLDALPVERLPQTIKDAITVTRGLKLKYLWIDALCIIQDSPDDKAIEITRMTEVYNCAYVTISASTAVTCRDGFLQQRILEQQPIQLRARFSRSKIGSVLLMVDPYTNEPIHTRGWTMQEHLLAPRLLSFGSLCMEYRCLSGRQRDGGTPLPWNEQQQGMPITEGGVASVLYTAKYGGMANMRSHKTFKRNTLLYRTGLMPLALKLTGEAQEGKSQIIAQWANIVEAYTARGLGFPDDRLNAISGIARKFHRPELGEFVAGLFSFELLSQLVWSRADSQDPLSRPQTYRAPSWSWASIDGQVVFNNTWWKAENATAVLIGVEVTPTSDNEKYNKYRTGSLTISGATTTMKLDLNPQTNDLSVPASHKGISIKLNTSEFHGISTLNVILLQVLRDSQLLRGLVLVVDGDKDTFRRIGYCELPELGDETAALREEGWSIQELRIV